MAKQSHRLPCDLHDDVAFARYLLARIDTRPGIFRHIDYAAIDAPILAAAILTISQHVSSGTIIARAVGLAQSDPRMRLRAASGI